MTALDILFGALLGFGVLVAVAVYQHWKRPR